jgi:hypothetical protein
VEESRFLRFRRFDSAKELACQFVGIGGQFDLAELGLVLFQVVVQRPEKEFGVQRGGDDARIEWVMRAKLA